MLLCLIEELLTNVTMIFWTVLMHAVSKVSVLCTVNVLREVLCRDTMTSASKKSSYSGAWKSTISMPCLGNHLHVI